MIDLLTGFFATSGIFFWLAILGVFGGGLYIAESGRPGLATVLAIPVIGLLCWLSGVNPLVWSATNPFLTIFIVVLYFVAGTWWGWTKWRLHVRAQKRKSNDLKEAFLIERKIPYRIDAPIPAELHGEWVTFLKQRGLPRSLAPAVKQNKARILAWMSYWPVSFVWTMIDDPVYRLFQSMYYRISENLQKYANEEFKNIDVGSDVEPAHSTQRNINGRV